MTKLPLTRIVALALSALTIAGAVYRFKDDIKGLVLKAAIKDIAIVDDTLVTSVSLIKLTAAVAGWLFGLALAGLVAIWSWSGHARRRDRVPNSVKWGADRGIGQAAA